MFFLYAGLLVLVTLMLGHRIGITHGQNATLKVLDEGRIIQIIDMDNGETHIYSGLLTYQAARAAEKTK